MMEVNTDGWDSENIEPDVNGDTPFMVKYHTDNTRYTPEELQSKETDEIMEVYN